MAASDLARMDQLEREARALLLEAGETVVHVVRVDADAILFIAPDGPRCGWKHQNVRQIKRPLGAGTVEQVTMAVHVEAGWPAVESDE